MQSLHKFLLLYVLTSLGQNGHGNRTIDGDTVPDNQMQYMASLQDNHRNHQCAGFLVNEKFLLTSASCDKKKLSVVYIGFHNLENINYYVHIERKCISSDADIMLLKLVKTVTDIKPIEIPNAEMDLEVNQVCSVAGWGSWPVHPECKTQPVTELRKMDVSVIDPRVCKENVTGLPANAICAGGTKRCGVLDAGSPLVCDGKAVGLFFNQTTDDLNFSTAYTNISKKHKWIKDRMANPKASDCRSHP